MLAAHVALLAKKAGHAVKIVYDRDEDIAATTKRHPACTRHRLAVDATRRARRDRRRLRDGRRRVPDAVAGRAVARRACTRPGRIAARSCACAAASSRRTIRRTARSAGSARRRPRSRTSARCRSSRLPRRGSAAAAQAARAAQRRHDGDRAGARLLGRHRRGDRARSSASPGPAPARDGTSPNGSPLRRGRGYVFYFHGAGFTGSGEQRLAGRATVARTAGGRYEVRSSSTDIGQGAITIFTQIAARRARRRAVDDRRDRSDDRARARQRADRREPHVHGGRRARREGVASALRRASSQRRARDGERGRGDACSTSRRPASTSTTRRTPAPRIPCFGWACVPRRRRRSTSTRTR